MGIGPQPSAGFYPYLAVQVAGALAVAGLVALAAFALGWRARGGAGDRPGDGDRPGLVGAAGSGPLLAPTVLRWAIGWLWVIDGLLQAQPTMPNGFTANVLMMVLPGQPGPIANLVRWAIFLWQAHPLAFASATVLIQVGIGLAILAGGHGRIGRLALMVSIGWGLVVWVAGEAAGGLLAPGASIVSGAPGAVLVYVVAAGLLLIPDARWVSGAVRTLLRRGVAGVLLLGALLQAIPAEGFWSARGLAGLFDAAAQSPQPSALAAPLHGLAGLAAAHPIALNAALIAAMATLGIGLLVGRAQARWAGAIAAWLVFAWWFGQDFGGLPSGTGTDPNLALPLMVMLGVALLAPAHRYRPSRLGQRLWHALTQPAAAAAAGMLLLSSGVALSATVSRASTSAATTVGGTVLRLPPEHLPDVVLTDQAGRPVSLRSWPHRVVALTFIDPLSSMASPLIAQELAAADRALGSRARSVELVAIDANPVYRSVADLRAFDAEQHLDRLRNWSFLTGSLPQLEQVWARFGLVMVVHPMWTVTPQLVIFARPGGVEVARVDDQTLPDAALTRSYISLIGAELRAPAP